MDTIAELRSYLSETDATWEVDGRFNDSDPIPRFPTGGDPSMFPPRLNPLSWDDFRSITSQPTVNPFLIQRRLAQGLMTSESLPGHLHTRMVPGGADPGPLPSNLPATPASVDWRQRFGWPWITTVQGQLCEDCWCFSATALMESMVRIEHCAWFKGSEFEVRWGWNPGQNPEFTRVPCADGGGPMGPIEYSVKYGLCDEGCEPYAQSNAPQPPSPDFSGRSVRYSQAGNVFLPSESAGTNPNYAMQKAWLDLNGPFIIFFAAAGLGAMGSGVFQGLPGAGPDHFVVAVGYDDSKSAWICKNSWGAGWNGDGYFYLEYGAAASGGGNNALYGTNPDPWTKRRLHAGGLLESGNGEAHRNLELVSTTAASGGAPDELQHYSRDGTSLAWSAVNGRFASSVDSRVFPSLLSSTYNRNFECVYLTASHELRHVYLEQATGQWEGGTTFGPSNCRGRIGFIQSNYGMPGNLEAVVATDNGSLSHWTRSLGLPWPSDGADLWWEAHEFGADVLFAGSTLLQSRYGTKGNFELVATLEDGSMQHFFRENDSGGPWNEGVVFGANIASGAVMIEGPYGSVNESAIGNFELCVAIDGGGIQHWQRDNETNAEWHLLDTFGEAYEISEVLGLVQGSLGFDFELVALTPAGTLVAFSRSSINGQWAYDGEIGNA